MPPRVEINDNGTVREDKSNTVKIFLNESFAFLKDQPEVIFSGISLGDDNFFEKVRKQVVLGHEGNSDIKGEAKREVEPMDEEDRGALEPGKVHLFFSLKPNFGLFKDQLPPESLAKVQRATLVLEDEPMLEVKVMFTKSLRPGHCLKEEFQVRADYGRF